MAIGRPLAKRSRSTNFVSSAHFRLVNSSFRQNLIQWIARQSKGLSMHIHRSLNSMRQNFLLWCAGWSGRLTTAVTMVVSFRSVSAGRTGRPVEAQKLRISVSERKPDSAAPERKVRVRVDPLQFGGLEIQNFGTVETRKPLVLSNGMCHTMAAIVYAINELKALSTSTRLIVSSLDTLSRPLLQHSKFLSVRKIESLHQTWRWPLEAI